MDTTVAHPPPRRRTDSSSRGPPARPTPPRRAWALHRSSSHKRRDSRVDSRHHSRCRRDKAAWPRGAPVEAGQRRKSPRCRLVWIWAEVRAVSIGLVPLVADLESARAAPGRGLQLEAGQANRQALARGGHGLEHFLLSLLDLIEAGVDQRDPLAGALALHVPAGLFHLQASDLHVAAVRQGDLVHPARESANVV